MLVEQAAEHFPIVDADFELRERRARSQVDPLHHVVDDQSGFDVGDDGFGADGVEIALHELAVAPGLRVFAPPHFSVMVALERNRQFGQVLRRVPGQRNGQVEAQSDVPATVVFEFVELLVGFLAAFSEQNIEVFQRRRVNRAETVGAVNTDGRFDEAFAGQHDVRQKIAKTFERARRDHFVVDG